MAYQWLPPSEKHQPLWPGECVEIRELPNGLRLEIWDYSRRLAGDRWLVGLLIQIPIRPSREHFSSPELYERFVREEGLFYYRYRKERHFVDEREREAVFFSLKENFLRAALDYLSHPEFAERFLATEVPLYERRIQWEEEVRRREEEAERLEELWRDRPL
ncbi:hypothetical protein FVE67_03435 [Thermosulfurimonas marina]|uniref:Uncharacterized protein n=1 Tax=Thermosulfurimonas marina TaxID=2047767 RepID=A0A6H1WRZ9_9BACT|nr:hypothetical protein [Thermosulfurimonas marina]QJA05906.1 hypothetical protein FVE67_03435 [Thermosulfurimonas marina]